MTYLEINIWGDCKLLFLVAAIRGGELSDLPMSSRTLGLMGGGIPLGFCPFVYQRLLNHVGNQKNLSYQSSLG